MKLTDTMNQRNSFDGIPDRNYNQRKHKHGQDVAKNDCELSDEHTTSEFSKKNINIQAAVIHVLGDFIQSIGVFVAALVIKFYVSFAVSIRQSSFSLMPRFFFLLEHYSLVQR